MRAAFRHFLSHEWSLKTVRAAEFQTYIKQEGESLRRFAIYCSLDEWIHREDRNTWLWTDWPAAFQNPNSPEVEEFARKRDGGWLCFASATQWQVDVQLARVQERDPRVRHADRFVS